MVSQSFTVGDFVGGIHLSEARETHSGFTSEAVAVSTAKDITHSEHSEHRESDLRAAYARQ